MMVFLSKFNIYLGLWINQNAYNRASYILFIIIVDFVHLNTCDSKRNNLMIHMIILSIYKTKLGWFYPILT